MSYMGVLITIVSWVFVIFLIVGMIGLGVWMIYFAITGRDIGDKKKGGLNITINVNVKEECKDKGELE